MSRVYSATFSNQNVNVNQDYFQIQNSSSNVVAVHEIRIGQDSSGTATQLRVGVYRLQGSMTGVAGTSVTPLAKEVGDPASAMQRVQSTSLITGSGTTSTSLWLVDDFNTLSGWYYLPAPEDRLYLAPGNSVVVRALTTTSAVMNGTVVWEEIG
jgi:hypothetical protein